MNTILIVEDDVEINNMISDFLKDNNYIVKNAYQGIEAKCMIKDSSLSLILMDLMIPYKSGDELIKELRTYSDVPVIVISAKTLVQTKIDVLRLGADDYIIKPFDLDELLARIETVLRRKTVGEREDKQSCLEYMDICMNLELGTISVSNVEVLLTAKEFAIIKLLLENPNKIFSKGNLYESVWGELFYQEDNTLNVHMSNLRNKLKNAGMNRDYIETVWGIGYRLVRR